MKKTIVFLFMAISVYGQEYPDSSGTAILFSVNEIKLDMFNGGFGVKSVLDKHWAAVASLYFIYNESSDGPAGTLNIQKSHELSIGFTYGYEYHFKTVKDISVYAGTSIGFGYTSKYESLPDQQYYEYQYGTEVKTKMAEYSFKLSLGVEYFLVNDISISGQYNLGAKFYDGDRLYNNSAKNGFKDLKTGISTGSLTLAVYF